MNICFKGFDLLSDPKYYISITCEADCNCEVIGQEPSFKYSGFTLDHKLHLEKHINNQRFTF